MPITVNCQQGSGKWLYTKLGKPSSSNFGLIVSPKGKARQNKAGTDWGETTKTYMLQLLGERLTGRTTEFFVSQAMEHGTNTEPEARAWYSMRQDVEVEQVGFITDDKSRWGCSPDGLVGADGGLEIKCPTLTNHLRHLVKGGVPTHWMPQIQGCLWITGRAWWDFLMYSDQENIPSPLIRVVPDPVLHAAFDEHIKAFCDELDGMEKQLREQYDIPDRPTVDVEQMSADAVYPF